MKKAIHLSIIVLIIVGIGFAGFLIFLRYNEKGETNMPFEITKISIISTTDADTIEDKQNLWNKSVEQNNDIYLYIEKNKEYEKEELIKSIKINNINIKKEVKKGNIAIYRPSTNNKEIFENNENFIVTEIEFKGDQKTNIQDLKISNQGGIIAFRCATQNLGNYISNEKEIKYDELLKNINISMKDIKLKIDFNLIIELENGKQFETEINLEAPVEGIIENGKSSKEITDVNCVFKRIEN